MSNEHDVQWTQYSMDPMDTMSNGHNVQWTQYSMDPMDTMFKDTMLNGHDGR